LTTAYGIGFLTLAIALACGGESTVTEQAPPASLVGTWRIVRHSSPAGLDSMSLPLGSKPRGYLVYDATGHVFLQVQDVGADSLRQRSWREAPDSILTRLLTGFRAYFGTYTVDSSALMVTHRIEGEFLPQGRGTMEVATPFRLRGDSLTLGADSLEQWHFVRVR
jgi:hypothetical protein